MFEHGQRIGTHDFSLIVARKREQHDLDGRVAFIAGKKLGNAVWRNRAKRRMRSICFALGGPFPGYDVVFIARRTVNDSEFDSMLDNARRALSKNGIIS